MINVNWEDFAKSVADYTGVEKEEITKETDLYGDLCMDSLGLFSLGINLTSIYKVQVPLSSVATIETVGDMYELMLKEGTPVE